MSEGLISDIGPKDFLGAPIPKYHLAFSPWRKLQCIEGVGAVLGICTYVVVAF